MESIKKEQYMECYPKLIPTPTIENMEAKEYKIEKGPEVNICIKKPINYSDASSAIMQENSSTKNSGESHPEKENPENLMPIYYDLLRQEKEKLKHFPVDYNFMSKQKAIDKIRRMFYINWIMEVHCKLGFSDESLYKTISIIDRYSSIKSISLKEYPCLFITAFMIACRHEEIKMPTVEYLLFLTCNYYSKEDVLNMEKDILLTLPYNLLSPSPIKFYEYLSLILGLDKKAYFLGKFLMESFLYDLNYIKFRPSIISCTCAYIAMKIFKKDNYKESYKKQWYKIEGEEGYEIEIGCNIKDCAKKICKFLKVILKGKSLYCYKKYSKDNCFYASNIIVNVYIKKKNNPIDDAHL